MRLAAMAGAGAAGIANARASSRATSRSRRPTTSRAACRPTTRATPPAASSGNPTRIREEIYEMNTHRLARSARRRPALRARPLRTNAGFAAVAIASLALGIGANTAIFQLLDAVRLRSLPVARPHEIVEVRITGGNGGMGMTPPWDGLTRRNGPSCRPASRRLDLFAWTPSFARVGRRPAACARRDGQRRLLRRARRPALARPLLLGRRRSPRRALPRVRFSATTSGSARWAAAISPPTRRC